MMVYRLTLKHKVKLLRNEYKPNGKPTIFAMTHSFKDDIACTCYCLPRSAYMVQSNKEGIRKTFYLLAGLLLNGVIWIDRSDKKNRATVLEQMKDVCKKGGDVLIAPEGAWNFTPNLPVMKLSWGLLDAAASSGANIVPIASDIVNGNYCVIIGSFFEHENYRSKAEAISALRDIMATMVWELFSMKPTIKRAEISDEYWLAHMRNELSQAPFLNYVEEEKGVYRPKGEISLGELLAEMHRIDYKSMAVDYEVYQRVEQLIYNWTRR